MLLSETKAKISNLSKLGECLRLIFRPEYEIEPSLRTKYASYFRVKVHEMKEGTSRILSYWCLNPGVILWEMKKIMQVRNIILTSGTLAPLEPLAVDLQIDFDQRLENNHVISTSQLMVGILGKGPGGGVLNSSWSQRTSNSYRSELGNAILEACKKIPNGILVFFPSYALMESCIDWFRVGEPRIWTGLNVVKKVFLEPKEKSAFNSTITAYWKEASEGKAGALMFAVCRGKISEGIDFRDERARAVIVTGIPFASLKEEKIILKRQYLDSQRIKGLTGNDWYLQQASRALNQAIGRVIRHVEDYGIVLLFDERFLQGQNISQLSRWLKPFVHKFSLWSECEREICKFFQASTKSFLVDRKRIFSREDAKKSEESSLNVILPNSPIEIIPVKPMLNQDNSKEGNLKKFCSLFAPPKSTTSSKAHILSSSERLQKTKEYVSLVRAELSQSQYLEFHQCFMQFSKSSTDAIPRLLEKIGEFLWKCGKFELFEKFGPLVHSQFVQHWRQLLENMPKRENLKDVLKSELK